MSPKTEENEVVDPLKNLEKLFLQIVEFILTCSEVIIVVLTITFLIILLLFLSFFNLLGF